MIKLYLEIITFTIIIANSCFSQQWHVIPSVNPSLIGNYYTSIGSISSNDVWAVGGRDTIISSQQLSRTLIEHWDGSHWSVVNSINSGSQYNLLNDVMGFSSNNVYSVGYSAGIPATPQMFIIHWDGSSWSPLSTPTITGGSELECILGFATNDIYAGGSKNIGAPGPDVGTLIVHWNGTVWDTLTTPNQSNKLNYIQSMKGLSTTDIYAVGYSKDLVTPFRAMVMHKSGSGWDIQSVPNVGSESFLYSVDVITSNNIWATGKFNDNGIIRPLFLHYDGNSWVQISSPGGGYSTVHNSATDIWSTGTSIVHYDIVIWTQVNAPIPNGGILRKTSRISSTDIWAAGEYFDAGIRKTLIMHFGDITGIHPVANEFPKEFKLFQNYPNPFNPSTKINFDIAKNANVRLTIFNIKGEVVATLVKEELQPGSYSVDWNAKNYSSGLYFYKLEVPGFSITKKLMIIK